MRAITALMLLCVALAAGGCGTDERVEYQGDLRAAASVVERTLDGLPADDAGELGPREVERLARDLRRAADDLASLDPPDDVAGAQRRLERGMRGITDSYDDLARRLRAADSEAEQGEVYVTFATDERIDDVFDDVVAAQEAYAEAGFRVFEGGTGSS